jgi:tetratricopeptide (TPR) repeat protein
MTDENNHTDIERWLKGEIRSAELFGLNDRTIHALAEHGYMLYQQGKYESAMVIFEALSAVDSDNGDFHRMLGAVYQMQENWDASYYHYTRVLRKSPHDAYVLANRGEVLLRLDRVKEATEDLRQAVSLDPQDSHPASRRARILLANLGAGR